MTKTSLNDLPVELLEGIRGYLNDLQSHVYFAQTCTKINSLYDDDMWRRILFAAGYGLPRARAEDFEESEDSEETMWETWAFAIVKDAQLFEGHEVITGWVTAERELSIG